MDYNNFQKMLNRMFKIIIPLMMVMGLVFADELHFVFELSRHGARAPTSD